jgi:transmembrane 9 superfamily protein 2/4
LFGDRLSTSPFQLKMLVNESCKVVCRQTIPKDDAVFMNDLITQNYMVNLMVDGLPAARKKQDRRTKEILYYVGFEYGAVKVRILLLMERIVSRT